MPDVSAKQARAMYAAKEGRSTLGIPQKVGAEFIAADKAQKRDTRPRAHQYARDHDEFHALGHK